MFGISAIMHKGMKFRWAAFKAGVEPLAIEYLTIQTVPNQLTAAPHDAVKESLHIHECI